LIRTGWAQMNVTEVADGAHWTHWARDRWVLSGVPVINVFVAM
jgi:hypothetical protein